ncbi:MAG TPA: hypothetical protein VEM76_00910 [Anaeromyxobacteraceae bacterium]|nr:hypothetical protein [Anaeromyxobacteraceae bacterium]
MEIPDREGLQRFVREHHVHYEVEPETAVHGEGTEVVGFGVRLLATHEEPKLEAPACPRCLEALSGLRSFAEQLVASDDTASWTQIVPEPGALRQSTVVHGADEVALTVRIQREPGEHRAGGASDDRRLSAIRERLEALGVPRS